MKKITVRDVCEKSYAVLTERAYSPEYTYDDHEGFDCMINGINFSFYPIDDEIFGYCVEFEIKEALVGDERARIERAYMMTDPEDVIFEGLHIDGAKVVLSSAFFCDTYPEDFIESSIEAFEHPDGVVAELLKLRAV